MNGPDILAILAATIRDISFWTGLVTVFAFSQGRFSEKQIDIENIDPPLPARYFTSRFRYQSSALVFSGTYVMLYVILIVGGSLPVFQDILKPLFGTVPGTSTTNTGPIGSPAWAAMVLMVVAPTIPSVRHIERGFRLWLQEFSDSPFKARGLAEEIIDALLISVDARPGLESAPDEALLAVFNQLEVLRAELTASGRNKHDQRYREFFVEQSEIVSRTVDEFHSLSGEMPPRRRPRAHDVPVPASSPVRRTHMTILVRRLARLTACALLYAESEEYAVRERLRSMPHLSEISRASFQFSLAQVLLAVLIITLAAVVTGPVFSMLRNFAFNIEVSPQQLLQEILRWSAQGLMIAIAFVLPLFLVAAVRHYMIDLSLQERREIGWYEKMMALMLAFVGAYGLSMLAVVGWTAYGAGQQFNGFVLMQALLWALPSAVVNTAFIRLSEIRWAASPVRNAAVDVAVFAAIGGGSAAGAGALLALLDIQELPDFGKYWFYFWSETPFVVTFAVVSGLNGALQCGASRVVEASVRGRPAKPVLVEGYQLYPDRPRLPLPGGNHELREPDAAGLPPVELHG